MISDCKNDVAAYCSSYWVGLLYCLTRGGYPVTKYYNLTLPKVAHRNLLIKNMWLGGKNVKLRELKTFFPFSPTPWVFFLYYQKLSIINKKITILGVTQKY